MLFQSTFFQVFRFKPFLLGILSALVVMASACRKESSKVTDQEKPANQGTIVKGLHQNNLGTSESNFLSLASKSRIHWQPWGKHIFEYAKQEQKTVFALIGSGTDPNTLEILEQLEKSATTTALLNQQHVNVLIDSNCNPAMEYFAASLCMRSGTVISRPILIWFSYEGNPISWSPASKGTASNDELISRMSKTVHRLWRDDPNYVLQNSQTDFKRRSSNTFLDPVDEPDENAPIRGIRQISSLYDPTSNNIDRIGKISPARFVSLLTKASTNVDLLESQRLRYGGIARLSAQNTIIYGLIDPIDGGVFDGVQRVSTSLPIFTKSLKNQALSMDALYSLYQLTEDEIYLTAANGIKSYTEQTLKLSSGDYMQGIIYANNKADGNNCTWTLEELEKALTEEELRVCKLAFDIRGLGNIPLVDDRNRTYFRKNTLTWKTTRLKLIEKEQIEFEQLEALLDSIMKKLSKIRTDRSPVTFKENLTTAKSLALYTSSLITAYRATNEKRHLQDAKRVYLNIKNNLMDESNQLHEARFNGKISSNPASATAHNLTCAAALDLYEITQEKNYLDDAQTIHNQLLTTLKGQGNKVLYESDMSGYPVDYEIMQALTIPNINNFSSWAIAWHNSKRLLRYNQNEELQKQNQALEKAMLSLSQNAAVILLDYLTKYSDLKNTKIYIHGSISDELHAEAIGRPSSIINMDSSTHRDFKEEVPIGSAAVVRGGKLIGITNQASELRAWLE